MRSIGKPNKNFKYSMGIFFIFLARTIVIGFAMFIGPYFKIEDSEKTSFKIIFVALDITNVFQFIFMFNVIERKNLFQFLLYIPLLLYSITLTSLLLVDSYQLYGSNKSMDLCIAIGFLYVYIGILLLEAIFHLVMYARLKRDFMWSNFKKVGANPAINEAFKRREQFNAVKRFSIMYLCSEFVGFGINYKCCFPEYFFTVGSLTGIFLMVKIFPNEEHILQRKVLLTFIVVCIVVSSGYSTIEVIMYFLKRDRKGILVLETWFYTFNLAMLFIATLRDYQTFDNGLREYYSDKVEIRNRIRAFSEG